MKNLMLFIMLFFVVNPLPAQTDREVLNELAKQVAEISKQQAETNKQIVETNKQIVETNKQQAIANTKFETKFEGIDKQINIVVYMTLGLLAGVFGIIIMIFWDRKAAMRPIEEKTQEVQKENLELKKEIALIKEKELKLEKRVLRNENDFKRIAEIDTRFARNP